jgi:GNAT superfamily N-acetyltransferase
VVEIVGRLPTPDEHRALAESVGWSDHFDWSVIPAALERSLHGVVAIDDGVVVGAARLVGDGVRYVYLQDVMVRPEASDRGIASALVAALLAWVEEQPGDEIMVGLFASPDAIGVYESAGFRAADEDPLGMLRRVRSR